MIYFNLEQFIGAQPALLVRPGKTKLLPAELAPAVRGIRKVVTLISRAMIEHLEVPSRGAVTI